MKFMYDTGPYILRSVNWVQEFKKKGTRNLDLESSFLPIAYVSIHIRSANLISIDNYMTVGAYR